MRRDLVCLSLIALSNWLLVSGAAAKGNDDDLLNLDGAPVKAAPKAPPRAPEVQKAPAPAAPAAVAREKSSAVVDNQPPAQPGVIDRVKAVPRKQLLKRRRLELTPYAGISLNDAYFQHLEFGGQAIFYPHDAFGIGLGVDYFYAHVKTPNVTAVRLGLTSVLAQFDLPVLLAHLDMYWLPIYGKVSLFDSWIVNFDMYASAGIGAATALGSRVPVTASFAVGQHFALSEWLALRLEVRDHLFVDLQRANEIQRSSLQSYVMFLVGLSFYIPPTFEYTFQ